jgi:predicted nucleic acid-binding protein
LILVDSSVWIDFLSASPGPAGRELRRLITEGEPIALTGIIVAEVLQGLTRDVDRIEQLLALFDLLEPKGFGTYREAAALFRLARSRGLTLTTADALIATVALEHRAFVFSLDADFKRVARLAPLRPYEFG